MVTDDERREVASHMRVLAGTALVTVPLLSEVISADFNCDANIWQRLADLIEPSGYECVPGECPLNVRHDNDGIDRERLLALAVNLDARATELLKANDLDQSRQRRSARLAHATDLMAACSRIREALGEAGE